MIDKEYIGCTFEEVENMGAFISTLGYEIIKQIISVFELICVMDLILQRKYLSWKKGFGYLLGFISIDIIITIYNSQSNYYIWLVIIMIPILYKGNVVHKIIAMCISISTIGVVELFSEAVLGSIVKSTLEVGRWETLLFRVGHLILIVVGVIILKSLGALFNKKQEFEALPKKSIFVLSGLSILSLIVFGGGILIYDGVMTATHNPQFLFILLAGILLLDLGILVIIDKSVHTRYYKQVNDLTQKQLIKQINYYERLEEVTKETRALKHDMINHMLCIKGLLESGEIDQLHAYIEGILDKIEIKTKMIGTGNTIVDAIINEKYSIAVEKDINIDIDVGLPKDLPIHMIDLCTIISNGIDNAIEASERISLARDRGIEIVGKYSQGYFIFEIKNKTVGDVEIKNNTIKSTKKDGTNHGYGLWNIKNSVEKYNGELRILHKENEFRLEVIINTSCGQGCVS